MAQTLQNDARIFLSRTQYKDWSFTVDPSISDQQRMNLLMKHELNYFNQLVEWFNARLRTNPKLILEITNDKQKLFLEVAEQSIHPRKLKADRPDLDEKWLLIFEAVYTNSTILPHTKRLMADSLLQYYKDQAIILSKANHVNETYFTTQTSQLLETYDNNQKRHLQVIRDDIKFRWDEKENCSYIKLPFIYGLKLANWNIEEHKNWNLAIIHQEPHKLVTPANKWQLELVHNNGYKVKYLDMTRIQGKKTTQRYGTTLAKTTK